MSEHSDHPEPTAEAHPAPAHHPEFVEVNLSWGELIGWPFGGGGETARGGTNMYGEPNEPPVFAGTPEAIAKAEAAHRAAAGLTGIEEAGAPANKPAMIHLSGAKDPNAPPPKPVVVAPPKAGKPVEVLGAPGEVRPRRSFLEVSFLAWVAFFAWLGAVGHLFLRFMFPNVLYEEDPKFMIGSRSKFSEINKVYEEYKEKKAVWVVRITENGQDRLVALSTVCTHLGCTPNWLETEKKYKCPCHGSGYYMDGVNFEGPTPRPLERFRIFVDGTGQVMVDKSKKFRKDLSQWDEMDSYVLMG